MVEPAAVERFCASLTALTGESLGPFGVAASGGPDSLALLLLAAAALPGRVRAVSIDHGLRPEAAGECEAVAALCVRLDVPHETVKIDVIVGGRGLQAAARDARRRAFGEWASRHGLRWIALGHHADDQAETVLMRLARGSGVGGLAGMPAISPLGRGEGGSVALVRPLLDWSKAELAAIVDAAGLIPASDPGNSDPRFDRTRFRSLLASTDLLDPRRLAAAAGHARDADDALCWAVERLQDHLIMGGGRVDLRIGEWPREVLRRMVAAAFERLGLSSLDGPKLDRLIRLVGSGRTATLAGIKVTPGPVWTFTIAPPRRTLPR